MTTAHPGEQQPGDHHEQAINPNASTPYGLPFVVVHARMPERGQVVRSLLTDEEGWNRSATDALP